MSAMVSSTRSTATIHCVAVVWASSFTTRRVSRRSPVASFRAKSGDDAVVSGFLRLSLHDSLGCPQFRGCETLQDLECEYFSALLFLELLGRSGFHSRVACLVPGLQLVAAWLPGSLAVPVDGDSASGSIGEVDGTFMAETFLH